MGAPADVRSKVVVRKLPPGISKEEVQAAIDGVSQGRYDWFSFVAGKSSLKRIKHSRAYLNFPDAAEVYKFRAQFGGHAFVNEKGAQYKCTVEYAPYQKVPRDKAKEDSREGTYEKDADFIAFKQQVEGEPEMLPSAEVQLDAKEQERKAALVAGVSETNQPKITPLMQFLHDKHALKPEKKAAILVPIKKKPSKPQTLPMPRSTSDADLPPHMASKPAAVQATTSKPPRAQQPAATAKLARADSGSTGNPPGYSQASPAGKGKKHGEQPAQSGDTAQGSTTAQQASSSRSITPSGKARQQDSRAGTPVPETAKSPAVPRKVVPIPLDRLSRRDSPRSESRSGGGQAAQPSAASGDNQADGKVGRKVRPGFQTWTPRRGRGDGLLEEEAGSDSALDAAKAAAAAALGSTQTQSKTSAENSSSTWGPSQTPGSGWDDDTPAQPLETTLPRNAGRGNVDSIRGRSGSNRGRGFAPMRPEPARHMADVDSAMPGATWDDDLPVPSSQVTQAAPVMSHHSTRGRGQSRGRGRGRGRMHGTDTAQTDMPPGGFSNPNHSNAATGSFAAPRTLLIKTRPQPADASSG